MEKEFKYKGFDYRLHKSEGKIAIYFQFLENNFLGYEVIRLKFHKGVHRHGTFYPDRYLYPTDNDWGVYGWTYKDATKAEDKFLELIKKEKK